MGAFGSGPGGSAGPLTKEILSKLQNQASQLESILEREGLITVGSRDQPVSHPAANQLHRVRELIARIESRLPPPASDSG
jgi:hypothetical protein